MSVAVASMPIDTLCTNGCSKKRIEPVEYETSSPRRASKRRCVQFAEVSSCKVVVPVAVLLAASDESDSAVNSSSSLPQEESPTYESTAASEITVDLNFTDGDSYEMSVPTKVEDGPSRITLATNAAILLLVEHGTITAQQVAEVLQAVADNGQDLSAADPWSPPPPDSAPASPPTPGSPSSLPLTPPSQEDDAREDAAPDAPGSCRAAGPAGPAAARPPQGCSDFPLCEGVYARLRALSDRIHASGRAPMLPSTAVMGREFLPALRFLRA
eukprot:CAMPEP_0172207796 /NCGR_PEP_ID=MMETSP1050-20130122/34058_1 /TAXON_ID=233186 /ORGANISM="Cryptomonas curvata, Strain CCAP979/52" /LENGTH=270 /DNA_ID=CAMNT_0012887201 /DNA_START=162 /DNA_END=971 /DNA_ORIENTATION=+